MTAALNVLPDLADATMPPERRGIARDAVRLLVTDRATGEHVHRHAFDLPAILREGDVLIVNDSATVPAAITARRRNGETMQFHVSTMIDERIFIAEPRGDIHAGEELRLPEGGSVVTIAPVDTAHPRLWYSWFHLPLPMQNYLARVGRPIHYGYIDHAFPLDDYQTIFARNRGSSEMPSAARPFTRRLVQRLREAGVQIASITLHCGVSSLEAPEHPSIERYAVPHETATSVNAARNEGRRVIAVGSTVVRALESAWHGDRVIASSGWSNLVVDGHHQLKGVDALLTGFHTETATHQWMLDAFASRDLLAEAYAIAAGRGYLRHEFGDVHLLV